MIAVSRSRTAFCAGVCTRSRTDARLSGLRTESASAATPRRSRSTICSVPAWAASTNARTSPRKCVRSHGTAVNWVRWVTSCRHTQSRKSRGSASSLRSTSTMFGATSRSVPGSEANTSYWPRTLPDRYASTVPACTPVTREPTALTNGPGSRSPVSLLTNGLIT